MGIPARPPTGDDNPSGNKAPPLRLVCPREGRPAREPPMVEARDAMADREWPPVGDGRSEPLPEPPLDGDGREWTGLVTVPGEKKERKKKKQRGYDAVSAK